jgi:diguanylate cyclase (GGDEF)-like protein
VTKPSDFSPERVLDVQQPKTAQSRNVERDIRLVTALGVVLFVAGIAVIVMTTVRSEWMIIDIVVLVGLGAYAYISASYARRISVNSEKQQRLALLVHNMELENMAMQDDLTQLFSRRYFFERLERELQTAHAFSRPLSVIAVDLDMMKAVNDTYGHRTGDEVLRRFGKFLLDHTRTSDIPARIGGDEFAVILPDTSEKDARLLMGRLSQRLEEKDLLEDAGAGDLKVRASFGFSGYPYEAKTVDEIMQLADAAMYAEKHARKKGGAHVTPASPAPVPASASPDAGAR